MLAIHKAPGGFSDRWINYCDHKGIEYKIVDCYKNDIVDQLSDCSALLWQFYQGSIKDFIMAKALLSAMEHVGLKTLPDFKSYWHFDDKVGQKYLLEAIGAPLASTWVFYNEKEALSWASEVGFPKVFKLRSGAGSKNVKLVKTREQARKLIRKAFGRGFSQYDAIGSLKERWRLYRLDKTNFKDLLEGIARIAIVPTFARVRGRERGYIYFQEFIPDNDSDIRVIVVGEKAFAIKRMVRAGDFRASGSGNIFYDRSLIDEQTVKLSFKIADKLETYCVAFDFVYRNNKPLILEISYGFAPTGYDPCPGYWDKEMHWHEGRFNPYGWMVENILKDIKPRR